MGLFTFGTGAGEAKSVMKSGQQLQGDAWNLDKSYLSQIRGALQDYLTGKVGFDPEQMALLKSTLLNTAAKNYAGANANVRTALARTGSAGGPVGGDYVRPIAALEGMNADSVTSGLAGIDLQNLQQALENKFKAVGVLSGNAESLNAPISAFTGQVNNALNQYTQAVQSGFGGKLMSNLGQTLGGGFGKMLGGGAAKYATKLGL